MILLKLWNQQFYQRQRKGQEEWEEGKSVTMFIVGNGLFHHPLAENSSYVPTLAPLFFL